VTRVTNTPREASVEAYRLEDQVGFVLRKAHQRASEVFNRVMAEFEVTPQQFSTIIKLDDVGETTQNRLGRLVAMDPATTLGVVSRLRKRGLVGVRPDPAHQRRLLVGLTAEGRAAAKRMRACAHEVSEAVLAPLSPEQRQRFMHLLGLLE
jgi:DNA-binding MarR family transcriptional regulator